VLRKGTILVSGRVRGGGGLKKQPCHEWRKEGKSWEGRVAKQRGSRGKKETLVPPRSENYRDWSLTVRKRLEQNKVQRGRKRWGGQGDRYWPNLGGPTRTYRYPGNSLRGHSEKASRNLPCFKGSGAGYGVNNQLDRRGSSGNGSEASWPHQVCNWTGKGHESGKQVHAPGRQVSPILAGIENLCGTGTQSKLLLYPGGRSAWGTGRARAERVGVVRGGSSYPGDERR